MDVHPITYVPHISFEQTNIYTQLCSTFDHTLEKHKSMFRRDLPGSKNLKKLPNNLFLEQYLTPLALAI